MPLLAEKPFTAEEPVTDAPRPRKEDLLPQIAALALAGQSCRQIAATFGLPKSNVHRWLQDLREGCPQRPANSAEMIADAVDYYKSLYRQALESFDLSQADKAQGSPEERGLREEKRLPEQRIAVGQVAATHVDVGTSNGRQPPVFARFSTRHARPVVVSTYAIRGEAWRKKMKRDRNCPIPIASG